MVNLFGITLSGCNQKEVMQKIEVWLEEAKPHFLVTPNPEILLEATRNHDEELFYILNRADLSLADGIGLKFAAWLYGRRLPRVTGADLVNPILKLAENKNKTVLFLPWSQGLSRAADIEKIIRQKYPRLNFIIKEIGRKEETEKLPTADIILVALGAPYQEKFIFHNYQKIPGLKVAIGIGGALDFLTKKAKRAPRPIRSIGFEWLWRLIKQPRRFKRIYRAFIIFPLEVIKSRFIQPLKYRPNVACVLYRRKADNYQVLMVERTLNPGHWQFPQGGTDGLDIKTAGIKEMTEEIGNNKFKVMAVYDFLYRYQFDSEMGKFPNQRHTGYKGQKQALVIAEFEGQDQDIKINFWDHSAYRWINLEEALDFIHPLRRPSAEIFLNKLKEII